MLGNSGNPVACPSAFLSGMTCYAATVGGCRDYKGATIPALDLTFGVATPQGTAKGVIVLHAGGGGTKPLAIPDWTNDLASDYVSAGFEVVQVAWASDWESLGNGDYDVKGAACRPARFFNYIYQTYYVPISGGSPKPGFCLHGGSAGAGAIAMYLAHYDGAAKVDKVVMFAGPQFSDLKRGCKIPAADPVSVYPEGSNYPCATGVTSWSYAPAYLNSQVGGWVGGGPDNGSNEACSNTHGVDTTDMNRLWLAMSTVDRLHDASFDYPQTDISAYLCAYGPNGGNGGSSVNPSSQQGWIFYRQLGPGSVEALMVHSAACWYSKGSQTPDPENVYYATAIDNNSSAPPFPSTCATASFSTGYAAMCNDMISSCVANH
jgi:hypothetical protein